jgi:hypothetical protein
MKDENEAEDLRVLPGVSDVERDRLRFQLRMQIEYVRECGGGHGGIADVLETLAEATFGKDWRPLFDWESRNR